MDFFKSTAGQVLFVFRLEMNDVFSGTWRNHKEKANVSVSERIVLFFSGRLKPLSRFLALLYTKSLVEKEPSLFFSMCYLILKI